jgi:hypothetical protein
MAIIANTRNVPETVVLEALGRDAHRKKHQTVAVIVVAEGWSLTDEDAKTFIAEMASNNPTYTDIDDHPRKQECVMLTGLTIDGRSSLVEMLIERSTPTDEMSPIVSMRTGHTFFPGDETDVAIETMAAAYFWRGFTHDD